MLYVVGQWNPSDKIKLVIPAVYYIPCDDQETAGKLLKSVQRFGIEKGVVVELTGMEGLKDHVARQYELQDFDLYEFPISTHTLLQDLGRKV